MKHAQQAGWELFEACRAWMDCTDEELAARVTAEGTTDVSWDRGAEVDARLFLKVPVCCDVGNAYHLTEWRRCFGERGLHAWCSCEEVNSQWVATVNVWLTYQYVGSVNASLVFGDIHDIDLAPTVQAAVDALIQTRERKEAGKRARAAAITDTAKKYLECDAVNDAIRALEEGTFKDNRVKLDIPGTQCDDSDVLQCARWALNNFEIDKEPWRAAVYCSDGCLGVVLWQ